MIPLVSKSHLQFELFECFVDISADVLGDMGSDIAHVMGGAAKVFRHFASLGVPLVAELLGLLFPALLGGLPVGIVHEVLEGRACLVAAAGSVAGIALDGIAVEVASGAGVSANIVAFQIAAGAGAAADIPAFEVAARHDAAADIPAFHVSAGIDIAADVVAFNVAARHDGAGRDGVRFKVATDVDRAGSNGLAFQNAVGGDDSGDILADEIAEADYILCIAIKLDGERRVAFLCLEDAVPKKSGNAQHIVICPRDKRTA